MIKDKKIITVANTEIKLNEYECQVNERSEYGLSIYLVTYVPCSVWEYFMPNGTLREPQYRDVNCIWWDFIRGGNKTELMNKFLEALSSDTGINFHVATIDTMPRSIYDRFTELGMRFTATESLTLIAYANNRKHYARGSSSSSGGSSCFLTTAMCQYYGKADDCYELNKLRQFRDTWMSSTDEGKGLISEYYAIAPEIVQAIERDNKPEVVYAHIKEIIDTCLQLLELGDNEKCMNAYKRMVDGLADQYNIRRVKDNQ